MKKTAIIVMTAMVFAASVVWAASGDWKQVGKTGDWKMTLAGAVHSNKLYTAES